MPWKSISSSASSKISASASPRSGGFFEYDRKHERLEEVGRELEDPAVWANPARAQELGRERARLSADVGEIDRTTKGIADAAELLELAEAESDEPAARDIERDAQRLEGEVRHLELKRMFSGEMDSHNAFLDIQAGAGGTEAQDWAQMLLRMYLRWGERARLQAEVIDSSPGEVAGIKSATIEVKGHMPTAGCAPRPACTAWCASRRSIRATAAIPRSPRCSSRRKWTTTSRSRSTPRT